MIVDLSKHLAAVDRRVESLDRDGQAVALN